MKASLSNAWAEMMLEQLWICRQVNELVARTIDPQLLLDGQALTERCLHPTEQRLNPLEFHGKRRSPSEPVKPRALAPARPSDCDTGIDTASLARGAPQA